MTFNIQATIITIETTKQKLKVQSIAHLDTIFANEYITLFNKLNVCFIIGSGQENMLNLPFVEITSTGFITDPCPRNRLL